MYQIESLQEKRGEKYIETIEESATQQHADGVCSPAAHFSAAPSLQYP
jgi:hypothetical protein